MTLRRPFKEKGCRTGQESGYANNIFYLPICYLFQAGYSVDRPSYVNPEYVVVQLIQAKRKIRIQLDINTSSFNLFKTESNLTIFCITPPLIRSFFTVFNLLAVVLLTVYLIKDVK